MFKICRNGDSLFPELNGESYVVAYPRQIRDCIFGTKFWERVEVLGVILMIIKLYYTCDLETIYSLF